MTVRKCRDFLRPKPPTFPNRRPADRSDAEVLDGSATLYRYVHLGNGDHFYTIFWEELGEGGGDWRLEGVAGYLPTTAGPDTADFHRYYNTRSGDHFYTIFWDELGPGGGEWIYEGVAGLIFTRP